MTYKEKVAWLQRYLKAREKAQFLEGCVQEMEAEAQGMRTRLDGLVIFRGILQANIVPAFRAMLAAAGLGIAMANGSANAKAAADRTGPDAEPHGVADLCRELWPEAF